MPTLSENIFTDNLKGRVKKRKVFHTPLFLCDVLFRSLFCGLFCCFFCGLFCFAFCRILLLIVATLIFRQEISAMAKQYYAQGAPRTVLEADCEVGPELLTVNNVESLQMLEPCGNGCPKPLLVMENLTVDRISQVGGGRHLRLRLLQQRYGFNGIFFSNTPQSASIAQGDLVDVAFVPQVNDFRGQRSVQMNILEIRPACKVACSCCAVSS